MHTTFKLNIFKLSTQYVDFSTAIYGAFEPHTHTHGEAPARPLALGL